MPDNFTPGTKRLLGLSPIKAAPLPALNLGMSTRETSTIPEHPEESEEDTEVMLAKMKQMVEGVKRRQSVGPRPSLMLSPKKPGEFSLLASTPGPSSVASASGSVRKMTDSDRHPFADDDAEDDSGDVEMGMEPGDQEQQSGVRPIGKRPALFATPQLTGVRELFRNPGHVLPTPRLDGVRDLFRVGRPPQTPAFEGMGEMLTTPAAYRAPVQPEPTEEVEMDAEVPEEPPVVPQKTVTQSRLRKPACLGSRLPAARRVAAPRSAPTRVPSKIAVAPAAPSAPAQASSSKLPAAAARVTRKPKSRGLEIEKVR